jgi:hypothetical protein
VEEEEEGEKAVEEEEEGEKAVEEEEEGEKAVEEEVEGEKAEEEDEVSLAVKILRMTTKAYLQSSRNASTVE